MRFIDLTGQVFGRLTVLERTENSPHGVMWKCRCVCGTEKPVLTECLRSGNTQSCGCLHKDLLRAMLTTHGADARGRRSPTYARWSSMNNRCTNTKEPGFVNYGGRGITVCDRWRYSFENFLADMGERPSPQHSIERRNNDLGYTPENCYWATRKEQNNNSRRNVFYAHQGERLTIAQWAQKIGLNDGTLRSRLKTGLSIGEALTIPVRPKKTP